VIRLPPAGTTGAAERYALTLMVDLARLVPVDDPAADVVRLEVVPGTGTATLAGMAGALWSFEAADGVVRVSAPVLRQLALVAGAGAERRSQERDRHGRVPSSANELVAAGLEREAVLGRAALALRQSAAAAAGRRQVNLVSPWPGGRRWAMAMTHDLDVVALWPVFTALRLAELVAKGSLGAATRAAGAALAALGSNPVWRGVRDLLAAEQRHGVRSTWFVLCGTPTLATLRAGDLTYSPESPATRRILGRVAGDSHRFGLHGSFVTSRQPAEFRAQRERLGRITGASISGVRQHFLLMRPVATQREMAAAGFAWDSSFGFPDRNGFRLGAADVIPLWDGESGQVLDIDEAPLCWMDRALSKYRGVEDPALWVEDALQLARHCRELNGAWIGVWHPNLVPALGFPGAPRAFESLLAGLQAHEPYVATLDEIVEWRRARRTARVRSVAPDGRLELVAAPGISLEVPAR
jgi:hypothetical protein